MSSRYLSRFGLRVNSIRPRPRQTRVEDFAIDIFPESVPVANVSRAGELLHVDGAHVVVAAAGGEAFGCDFRDAGEVAFR